MRISVKALRTKPPVSVNTAVGAIELKADSIADACLLTAIASAFTSMVGDEIPNKKLIEEIGKCAHEVGRRIVKHDPVFEMFQPKRRKA